LVFTALITSHGADAVNVEKKKLKGKRIKNKCSSKKKEATHKFKSSKWYLLSA